MIAQGVQLVVLLIVDAMIGQQDYKGVIPCFRLLEFSNEIAYTLVEIVEGIKYFVVELVYGNIPRFMLLSVE